MRISPRERLALQIIDIWLEYRYRYHNLPGFQICIRKKGDILFSKAYGYANLKTRRQLTTNHLFHIASHSKTITACLLLQLVEKGRLSLNQPLVAFLPDLASHQDKRFKQITLRDLVSNRSGIFRDGIDSTFWDLQKPFLSKQQLLEEVLSAPLIYSPNTHSKYSNIGFSLLGLVIEKCLGIPYQKAVEELILKKIKDSQLYADYEQTLKDAFADGHSRAIFEGKRLPLKHAAAHAMAPTTGFCATAENTSLFFAKFLLGKSLIGNTLQCELLSLNWPIKNSTYERYGLGLEFNKFSDIELVGHSGGYPGFSTDTQHWLGTEYTFSFFLNTNEVMLQDIIVSMIRIITKIKLNFTDAECQKAETTGPIMNKWGSQLFIVLREKALSFNLESWLPVKDSLLLKGDKAGGYTCPRQNGYGSVGEKISFSKDKEGKITAVKWGSFTTYKEQIFLSNFRKGLL